MKVIIENIGPDEEEQLILRCREVDESLLKLINHLKTGNTALSAQKVIAQKGSEIFRVEPKDMYYFESVDNKVFLYTRSDCFEVRLKLYEVERELGKDFFRISKSVIVNLSKINSLAPAFSGRLEATLKNGEKVIISRQYVSELKENLGL